MWPGIEYSVLKGNCRFSPAANCRASTCSTRVPATDYQTGNGRCGCSFLCSWSWLRTLVPRGWQTLPCDWSGTAAYGPPGSWLSPWTCGSDGCNGPPPPDPGEQNNDTVGIQNPTIQKPESFENRNLLKTVNISKPNILVRFSNTIYKPDLLFWFGFQMPFKNRTIWKVHQQREQN